MFVLLSLLAAAFASSVNFADKAFLGKYEVDFKAATIFGAVAGGILALLVLPVSDLSALSLSQIFLIVSSGCVLYVSYLVYWKTMSKTNASSVVMLIQLSPALVLLMSYALLNEVLTGKQFAGFVLILVSAALFTTEHPRELLRISAHDVLVLGFTSAFLFAVAAIIQKYAIEHTTVLIGAALEGLGVCIAGSIAFLASRSIRENVFLVAKKHGLRPFVFIFIVEAIWIMYRFLSYAATAFGPVAIERALEGTRVFFALLFGAILSRTMPSIFAGERSSLTPYKFGLACVLVAGIYLIS